MRHFGNFGPLIGAVHVGTDASRFLVYAANTSEVLTYHQIAIKQFSPQENWIEQDAIEIINSVIECIEVAAENLRKLEISPGDLVAVGITNQRETVIAWNYVTGKPLYSAIAWSDGRTSQIVDEIVQICSKASANAVRYVSGLPISTYFSSVKIRWLIKYVHAVQDAIKDNLCYIGTIDSWLIWNLTGGINGGVFATDVTNASRTQLMSLRTLDWDPRLLRFFNVPHHILPNIKSSSEIYGYIAEGSLAGVPIAGCIGDQQAALLGQSCTQFGQAHCYYNSGSFLLYNTGNTIVHSEEGLLTTVAYKLGSNAPTVYALEGCVAVAGTSVEWLREGLGLVTNESDLDNLSKSEQSLPSDPSPGFVPAFSGLYAPHWRKDAKGVICGLSSHTTTRDVSSAAIEAICQRVRELASAAKTRLPLTMLVIGGPFAHTSKLPQLQADLLGITVVRPLTSEPCALGAACAAGSALGVWPRNFAPPPADVYTSTITDDEREIRCARWKDALDRSMNWDDGNNEDQNENTCPRNKRRLCRCNQSAQTANVYAALPISIFFFSSVCLMILADKLG